MRVAYVITRSDDLGGAQVHVRDLTNALAEHGHESAVFAGAEGILAEQLRSAGVPFFSLRHLKRSITPLGDIRAVLELRRKLSEYRPDLISTHCSKAGLLGRLAGRWLGVPTLFTAHGWRFPLYSGSVRRWITRAAERTIGPLSTGIVTVCESDRDLAIRERIAPADVITTIHNAMPDIGEDLRADPGRNPESVRLVMVARFVPQKDHLSLVRALANVTDLGWQLDLIGSGQLETRVRQEAERMGLGQRIAFLGFQRDVPRLLARSNVFVLSSRWEGLPRSILEAMRAGLPVIASDVGGVREAVVEGETGFLIPRGDAATLQERLRDLVSSPRLRDEMGKAGRRLYEERFAFPVLLESTLALYEKILRDGQRGNSDRVAAEQGAA